MIPMFYGVSMIGMAQNAGMLLGFAGERRHFLGMAIKNLGEIKNIGNFKYLFDKALTIFFI
jgi:hypothetical protein